MDCIEDVQIIAEQLNLAKDLTFNKFSRFNSSYLSSTRSSLLLIDNVIELLMYHYLKYILDLNEKQNTIMKDPLAKKYAPNYQNRIEISALKKGGKLWGFPNKVDFLVNHKVLDRKIGEIIKYVHDHRNSTYHHQEFQFEVIYPLNFLLFNTACDLLAKLAPPHLYIYVEKTAFNGTFLKNYGIDKSEILDNEVIKTISHKLKEDAELDLKKTKRFITTQFYGRIRALKKSRNKVLIDFKKNRYRVLAVHVKKHLHNKEVKYFRSKKWEDRHNNFYKYSSPAGWLRQAPNHI